MVKASSRRSVMSVWLISRLLLFYEENILLDINVRKWNRIDVCFWNLINIMLIRVRLPPRVGFRKFLSEYMHIKSFEFLFFYISTWSYENRVSKHFVISLNFPCLMACLLSCLLMCFFWFLLWFGLCVDVAVDRISNFYLPPPPPPLHHHFYSYTVKRSGKYTISLPLFLFFSPYPQFSLKHRCRLAVYISLLVTLRKFSRRASCKALR